jgi:aerobic-type carbon monoxide dehydrogenase small subunit (CoxS/CutS family)
MKTRSMEATTETLMTLQVNGRTYRVTAPMQALLIEALRDHIGLTGAKYGCGMGECGACTVLLDGEPVCSCLTLAIEAQGREITTIEGLDRGGALDPVQRAFAEMGGVQCGFCTPGMILAAKGLLARNPSPSEEEIRLALSGNLCRCTGYMKIVDAVRVASQEMGRAE